MAQLNAEITIAICYSIFWVVIAILILYPKMSYKRIQKRIDSLKRNKWGKKVKKSKIIALIGVALSAVIIIIFLTQNVRPYLNVSQVTENPSSYENKEVQVIGIVQGITDDYFNLTEGEDSILVYAGDITVPDDVENGLQIVVTGVIDTSILLVASQILTQCSWTLLICEFKHFYININFLFFIYKMAVFI